MALLVMLPVGRVSLILGAAFDGWRACAGMVLLIGELSFLLFLIDVRDVALSFDPLSYPMCVNMV